VIMTAIGSVFPMPLDVPNDRIDNSLWQGWTAGGSYVSSYSSARSALAALLRFRGIQRIWLPDFCCSALVEAAGAVEIGWYATTPELDVSLASLVPSLRPGDAVLGIDYFGRAPRSGFLDFVRAQRDILWIEDRAHALNPGLPAWGDIVLYSPRKLLGVGDGGVMVSQSPLPSPSNSPTAPLPVAQRQRQRDPEGLRPDQWFSAFKAQEAAFCVDDGRMSDLTKTVLERADGAAISARRQSNARLLAAALEDLALWPTDPIDYAPLAFPICVADRDGLAQALAEQRIYCAKHWTDLPNDPALFPVAHSLSAHILSLPCDQRYDQRDMVRIVTAIRALHAEGAR
jgi:dTDP-4-amino-4,6-dideoxygalactose transaminase